MKKTPSPGKNDETTRSLVLLDIMAGEGGFDQSILERMDHDVVVCNGPDMKTLCPLLGGTGCSKFEEAHGVVFELDLDRPQHRAILKRYEELGREKDLPIRVVVSAEQQARHRDLLAHVQVWDHSPTVADLDGFAAQVDSVDRFSR